MMDGARLGEELKSAVDGIEDKTDYAKLWEVVASAIVTHISENAEVLSGIPVSTTGSASAHSGSTTGAGKIR